MDKLADVVTVGLVVILSVCAFVIAVTVVRRPTIVTWRDKKPAVVQWRGVHYDCERSLAQPRGQ